ncbi:transmembrane protein 45B-like [Chenopodium quinoa]|uniref:transmembrane protein 45B-like n=1 Tax=Chenopodium quinoa TaxID=63459 RepID=UPI000B77BE8D|nr:transmembrane protein 45B-like [Chenopodium quinoa]
MGLFSMAFAGGSFILLGAWESLSSSSQPPQQPPNNHRRFSTITLISAASLSLLFIINSLLSFFDAISSSDKIGSTLQLQVLAISSLFFMFSLLGLLNFFSKSLNFPFPLLNLILLFAFLEEFLLFHLHLKDSDGIENRYYDLMLVPIAICVFSTMIELVSPNSGIPKLGRGLGLILKGTWFVQIGFSFFSDLIANNCALHYKSRGNYTINCNGHMDTHRGGAIAVLLFNCHLAFLVTVICGVYSCFGRRFAAEGNYSSYRPLGVEVLRVENQGTFTLDSDSDDGGNDVVKQEDGSAGLRRENGAVELGVNGHGSHSVS